ncbi:cold-shock protein [Micromonospora fulviviridis]|uniref:Cold shock domain-containing protein n=1 Tax=Micromonospora fulviviridis TaxID=47860 RepID=A0ABV2VUS7_9ACTN
MRTGRIIRFNAERGFGFIAPDDGGEDIFLHAQQLGPDRDTISAGTPVQFEGVKGQRGYRAHAVTVLAPQASEGPAAPIAETRPETDNDEDLLEVISAAQYANEITDAIIRSCPDVTAAQIVAARQRLVSAAGRRGWLDD